MDDAGIGVEPERRRPSAKSKIASAASTTENPRPVCATLHIRPLPPAGRCAAPPLDEQADEAKQSAGCDIVARRIRGAT